MAGQRDRMPDGGRGRLRAELQHLVRFHPQEHHRDERDDQEFRECLHELDDPARREDPAEALGGRQAREVRRKRAEREVPAADRERGEQRGNERKAEDRRAGEQRVLQGGGEHRDRAGLIECLRARDREAAAHHLEQVVAETATEEMQPATGDQHDGRGVQVRRARDLAVPACLVEALLCRLFGAFGVVVGHGVSLPAQCAGT